MKRVVLITGVAGGIGQATAGLFARKGWRVMGVDSGAGNSIAAVDRFIQADVSDLPSLDDLADSIQQNEGRLDALVHNAAKQVIKPFLTTTYQEWDEVMATNLRAIFFISQKVYPLLKTSKGSVINVGSVHAVATSKGIAAYAASKGGVSSLTRAMALEFADDGIRVNAVLPGAIDTPMLRAGLKRDQIEEVALDEQMAEFGERHPLRRIGQPTEIAQAILFLADAESSSFMTGQTMIIDGGATARLSTE